MYDKERNTIACRNYRQRHHEEFNKYQNKWQKTDKGREIQRRYQQSDKGKAVRHGRYYRRKYKCSKAYKEDSENKYLMCEYEGEWVNVKECRRCAKRAEMSKE